MSVFYNLITSLNLDPAALGSIEMPPPAPTVAPVAPVKHRACDECRTRKLACSKDDDGCARCKKENIICRYSEQKPMGRPRKRQFVESTEPATTNLSNDPLERGATPPTVIYAAPYTIPEPSYAPFMNGNRQPEFSNVNIDPQLSQAGIPYVRWHFGGSSIGGPPINYGDVPLESDSSPGLVEPAPPLSNGSSSDSANSPQAPHVPCGCLASMYLSLASLQQLPSESVTALKTVRGAAQVAANSIWCAQCGSVAVDNPNPPIEAFQNTMLLGTILPIIANGYQRLLKIIDDETNAAEAAGQTKMFRFLDYGGLCGHQASIQEALDCVEKELMFKPVEMPAHQWRTTVRALLRIDIYGHEQGGYNHKGLKDLVSEMEIRQKARHDMLEQHHANGSLGHGIFNQNCVAGENGNGMAGNNMFTCMQILNIAKLSIDNLVIA